ncbi:MAG: sodium/substrate symporter small subunit [Duganella sp.]
MDNDIDTAPPTAAPPPASAPLSRRQHWRQTRRMTGWLLLLWLLTGFCVAFFARELTGLSVFGWPLSFYLAAQGASLVYLAILGFYAWRMRRLDLAASSANSSRKPSSTQKEPRP